MATIREEGEKLAKEKMKFVSDPVIQDSFEKIFLDGFYEGRMAAGIRHGLEPEQITGETIEKYRIELMTRILEMRRRSIIIISAVSIVMATIIFVYAMIITHKT